MYLFSPKASKWPYFLFKFNFTLLINVYKRFACMYVCVRCRHPMVSSEVREGVRCPETEAVDSCAPPCSTGDQT